MIRQRWEYTSVVPTGNIELVGVLNKLGNEGWEIVTIIQQPTFAVIFKRPKSDLVVPRDKIGR